MFSGNQFPSGMVQIGDRCAITDNNGLSIYRYIGGNPRVSTNWVLVEGRLAAQPDTTGWGTNQAGAAWYNYVDSQAYMWDGVQIVINA